MLELGTQILALIAAVIVLVGSIIGVRRATRNVPGIVVGSRDWGEALQNLFLILLPFLVMLALLLFLLIFLAIMRGVNYFRETSRPSDPAVEFLVRQDSIRAHWDSATPDLSAMYEAARLIDEPKRKDEALAHVAWISAARGNGYFAIQAARVINDAKKREAALDSILHILGRRGDADPVAQPADSAPPPTTDQPKPTRP